MAVDDGSVHLGINISNASWEFAAAEHVSGLACTKLIEADWVR